MSITDGDGWPIPGTPAPEPCPFCAAGDLLFKYAKRRCAILVEHYWPEIMAVADLLMKHRSLSGERVRQAWADSIENRCGRRMSW